MLYLEASGLTHPSRCVIAWDDVVCNVVTYALYVVEVHAGHKRSIDALVWCVSITAKYEAMRCYLSSNCA